MNHGSLFSGIGGFDLASEWMGWKNIFHCEWNEFGQKILKYYWPNAISYGDITKTDFAIHRGKIDILTGGFPCQPYSVAGKRNGKYDDRHLWPEMLRAIGEIQPRWVVGENVRGLTNWNGGVVFDEVQSDLETKGYEVLPFLLPACAVGAPHRRERIWVVAYNTNSRTEGIRRKWQDAIFETASITDSENIGHESSGNTRKWWTGSENSDITIATDPSGFRRRKISQRRLDESRKLLQNEQRERRCNQVYIGFSERRNASDTNAERMEGRKGIERKRGEYEPIGSEIRNKIRAIGVSRTWQNFPTQSPVCSRDDGISSRLDGITFPKWRNESIKAHGNAVVPELVYEIFKAIELYENKILL